MEAQFNSQTLAEIFRDLFLAERSGVLVLSHGGVEKRIHLDRGLIHFAESTAEGDDLGARLVGERKLSAGALQEARESADDPRELPRVLIQRDLVSRDSLTGTVKGLVGSVVTSVFGWESGASRFHEGESSAIVFDADVISTFQAILNGIFTIPNFGPVSEALLALDNRLRVRRPAPIPMERLTLSPAHGFILSRIDGTTTVSEVQNLLPPAEEDSGMKFLFGLLVMGVLELDPALGKGAFRLANILRDHADRRALEGMQEQTILQAHEAMRDQPPHTILGVAPDAPTEAIERAYEEAKALFSRDRILPRVREKYRSQLAVIEGRLIESYLTLARPQSAEVQVDASVRDEPVGVEDLLVRVEMDKAKSKLAQEEVSRVADSYYDQGIKAAREGDFHNAIQFAKLAISHCDSDARYFALMADCLVRNPEARWQRMAEQNFARAADLDPWNVDYRLNLAHFYKKRGLRLRARKQFEEALRIAPNHEQATRELESLAG